jgi:hypothetical protein
MPTFPSFDDKCRLSGFVEAIARRAQEALDAAAKKRRLELKAKGIKEPRQPKQPQKLKINEDGDIIDGQGELDGIGDAAYRGATVIDLILGFFKVPVISKCLSPLFLSELYFIFCRFGFL